MNLSARDLRLLRVVGPIVAGLLLLAAVWLWWLPALAQARINSRLARHGLVFQADSLRVGLGSVSAAGVRIVTAGVDKPLLQDAQLDVGVSLFGGQISAIDLEGGSVELSAKTLKQLRMRAAQGEPSSSASTNADPAAPLPRIHCGALRVRLTDEQGALLDGKGLELTVADSKVEGALASLVVGGAPGEVLEADGVQLSGTLLGRAPQLGQLSVQKGTLRVSSEAREADKTALTDARTLQRISRFRDLGSGDAQPTGASRNVRSRWADDARIELKNLSVIDVASGGAARTLLSGLTVRAVAKGPQVWALSGQGSVQSEPGSKGSMGWDLRVTPAELKVEGSVKLDEVALSLFAPVLPPLPFHALDRARVRADLRISGNGLASAAVEGDLSIRDLMFASAGLAETEVGPISLALHGKALWTPARRELSDLKAELRVGKTKTVLSGVLAWPSDGYRVDLTAELQRARCSDVLSAVPAGLLGELSTVELAGDIAAKVTVHVDANDLDATKVDFDFQDKCQFGALPPMLDLRRFERPFIHQVFEPDGTSFEMETGPGTAAWTPIELISPFMTQGAIGHEDGRFLSHHGFAEAEIGHALARNLKARAFRFGASTITMQLVKNLFLHRDKLLSRKVQEAFIVWWLEQQWDKRRILELYLNVIEYGPALYGIRNAALHYFGTIPMNLTPAQVGFLACILPNPKLYHEQFEKGALSESMKKKITSFLQHLHNRQRIDDAALQFGLEELKSFKFYDPTQPPPMPTGSMGNATPLPFIRSRESWDMIDIPEDDGSFGL